MFPTLEPFATGLLPVSDENAIYWETSGNPRGIPALHLHGGPGSGLLTGHRRRFDPERFLIVALEQRGCGRSRPLVTESRASLAAQTTEAVIRDIEALRTHLGINSFLVNGISWGATLALAYAQAHPDRVRALALMCVTTTTAAEVEWMTEGVGPRFPEAFRRFEAGSARRPGERLVDAYYRAITDPDPRTRTAAARAWCDWEDAHVSRPDPHFENAEFRQVFATLVVHYFKHAAFLSDGALLSGMPRIAHLPGALIHGRLDVSSLQEVPVALHRAWPNSTLTFVEHEGHGGPDMVAELVKANARLGELTG